MIMEKRVDKDNHCAYHKHKKKNSLKKAFYEMAG